MATAPIYSDFMTNLDTSPLTRDMSVLTDIDAVKKSVRNLILTNFYERPFQPGIGSGIRSLLFENQTPVIEAQIKRAVNDTLQNYEPRAKVIDVRVISNIDYNELRVIIVFYVLGKADPVSVDLIIDRVR
jgi:phage baseplate assembly protein W